MNRLLIEQVLICKALSMMECLDKKDLEKILTPEELSRLETIKKHQFEKLALLEAAIKDKEHEEKRIFN